MCWGEEPWRSLSKRRSTYSFPSTRGRSGARGPSTPRTAGKPCWRGVARANDLRGVAGYAPLPLEIACQAGLAPICRPWSSTGTRTTSPTSGGGFSGGLRPERVQDPADRDGVGSLAYERTSLAAREASGLRAFICCPAAPPHRQPLPGRTHAAAAGRRALCPESRLREADPARLLPRPHGGVLPRPAPRARDPSRAGPRARPDARRESPGGGLLQEVQRPDRGAPGDRTPNASRASPRTTHVHPDFRAKRVWRGPWLCPFGCVPGLDARAERSDARPKEARPPRLPSEASMAGWTGLEPATSDVTGRRSNQLNYHPAVVVGSYPGGRYRIRTCDPRLVRPVLHR